MQTSDTTARRAAVPEDLQAAIRRARVREGLTFRELAARFGLHPNTVYKVVNRKLDYGFGI